MQMSLKTSESFLHKIITLRTDMCFYHPREDYLSAYAWDQLRGTTIFAFQPESPHSHEKISQQHLQSFVDNASLCKVAFKQHE